MWIVIETKDCSMRDLDIYFHILMNLNGKLITRWKGQVFELRLMNGTNGKEYSAFDASSLSIMEMEAFKNLSNHTRLSGKGNDIFGIDLQGRVWALKEFPQTTEPLVLNISIPVNETVEFYQVINETTIIYTRSRKNKHFLHIFNSSRETEIPFTEVEIVPKLMTLIDDEQVLVVFGPFYTVIELHRLQDLDDVDPKDVYTLHGLTNCYSDKFSYDCFNDRSDALVFYDSQLNNYIGKQEVATERMDAATFFRHPEVDESASFFFYGDKVLYMRCPFCHPYWLKISKAFPEVDFVNDKIIAATDAGTDEGNPKLYIFTEKRVLVFNITFDSNKWSFHMKLENILTLPRELTGLEAVARSVDERNRQLDVYFLCINGSLFFSSNAPFPEVLLYPFTQQSIQSYAFSNVGCIKNNTWSYYTHYLNISSDKELRNFRLERSKEKLKCFFESCEKPRTTTTTSTTTNTSEKLIPKRQLTKRDIQIMIHVFLVVVLIVLKIISERIVNKTSVFNPQLSQLQSSIFAKETYSSTY